MLPKRIGRVVGRSASRITQQETRVRIPAQAVAGVVIHGLSPRTIGSIDFEDVAGVVLEVVNAADIDPGFQRMISPDLGQATFQTVAVGDIETSITAQVVVPAVGEFPVAEVLRLRELADQ